MTDEQGGLRPVVVAAAIFLIVLIGTGLVVWWSSGDALTNEGRVGQTVNAQNAALQRHDYPAYEALTCAAVRKRRDQFLADQEDSERVRGHRFIDDVTGIVITGDTAKAKVVSHYEKSADTKITADISFVREDGAWKVCSGEPVGHA